MAKRSKKRMSAEDKRRKYISWGMTIFMGVILTTSLFIIAFQLSPSSQANAIVYGGVSFSPDRSQSYYEFTYEGVDHRTLALPQEVEETYVPEGFVSATSNVSRITIARNRAEDAYLAVAVQFLSESLISTNRWAVTQAFTEGQNAVNCSAASPQNLMILFESSNVTQMTYNDSCLTLEYADPSSIIISKNAVLYRMLGIIR